MSKDEIVAERIRNRILGKSYFWIGDIVKLRPGASYKETDNICHVTDGMETIPGLGIVYALDEGTDWVGVRWRNRNNGFHDLRIGHAGKIQPNKSCPDGFGWYVKASALKLVRGIEHKMK